MSTDVKPYCGECGMNHEGSCRGPIIDFRFHLDDVLSIEHSLYQIDNPIADCFTQAVSCAGYEWDDEKKRWFDSTGRPALDDRVPLTAKPMIGIINSGGVTDSVRANIDVDVEFVDLDDLDDCGAGRDSRWDSNGECNGCAADAKEDHTEARQTLAKIEALRKKVW